MIIRFWGTRGSLPVAAKADAVRRKVASALVAADGRRFADHTEALAFVENDLPFDTGATYGGATACVEIDQGDEAPFVVCDMGSGLREFGIDALKRCAAGHRRIYHFFLSHLHWDHIMGFPFLPRRSTRKRESSFMPDMARPNTRFAASRRKSHSQCRSSGSKRALNS